MKIYQVIYENQYGEKVADFGFYEAYLDAEERAFEVRTKTSLESGKVRIEELHVHERKFNPYITKRLKPYRLKAYAS